MRASESRAPTRVNHNADLFHFSIEVGRVVIMLEAAKDSLLNRDYPALDSQIDFFSEVDAHLEVCTGYLRMVHAEMEAVEGRPRSGATDTAGRG